MLARAVPVPGMTLGRRTLWGAACAVFPDSDIVAAAIDPLLYLNLHRGPTHSLVLLPLWALLLAASGRGLLRLPLRPALAIAAMGIAIHIAGDVITSYGTKVLYPLSDVRVALSTTFIIDPILSGILGAALVLSRRRLSWARGGLALVLLYVGLQGFWHHKALAIAEGFARERGLAARAYALPQPFSPLRWKLVVATERRYFIAYVHLYGRGMGALAAAYQPPEAITWRERPRFGTALAREVWEHPAMEGFRRFAVLPALYRIDRGEETCVWLTDLRFAIDGLTPPFRFGMCRRGEGPWRLYRLSAFGKRPLQGRAWAW